MTDSEITKEIENSLSKIIDKASTDIKSLKTKQEKDKIKKITKKLKETRKSIIKTATTSLMPSRDYNLGPLPWSDANLVAAAWGNFIQAQEWVDEHPGRTFVTRLESLKAVQRIFEESATQFNECLACFHAEALGGHLFHRNRRSDLEAYEHRFQKLLYVFASSAMMLVDQARTLSEKVTLPGYDDRIDSTFANNPKHRFVQELRNDVTHVTLHRPGWELTTGRGEESTSKFMLWPKQLTRIPEYNEQARRFVDEHPKGIDLGRLIVDYSADVREFHEWLRQTAEGVVGDMMADYLRCTKRIKAVSARSFWNIIFQQVVIAGKRDPYTYLDQYLTEGELAEVNTLPHRSQRQIDQIIELVDEHEACDDELRQIIYKAFGASA